MMNSISRASALALTAAFAGVPQPGESAPDVASVATDSRASQSAEKGQPSKAPRGNVSSRLFMGLGSHGGQSRHGYPRTNWPVSVDRRRAKKARNVQRNKAAHRGRKSAR